MAGKADDKKGREGAIRCQCTLASESQITDIFRQFAKIRPDSDIDHDYVSKALSAVGLENAEDGVMSAGERQCYGCDPLLHRLVEKFNETHDADILFARKRKGGRNGRLARIEVEKNGLCDFARHHDYSGMAGQPPDLTRDPVNSGRPKVKAPDRS